MVLYETEQRDYHGPFKTFESFLSSEFEKKLTNTKCQQLIYILYEMCNLDTIRQALQYPTSTGSLNHAISTDRQSLITNMLITSVSYEHLP